jgi:hypothetical protein
LPDTLIFGFDVDRVVFDTNTFMQKVNEALAESGTSIEELSEKGENRKDIGALFRNMTSKLGTETAEKILFKNIKSFVSPEIKEIACQIVAEGHKVAVISVGSDGYQEVKLAEFPCWRICIVPGDAGKVDKALEIGVNIFVDDKIWVVNSMREKGINAYQALWFLDEKHRENCLPDALATPEDLKAIVVKLLKSWKKAGV